MTCVLCGKTVELNAYMARVTKYCSRECYRNRALKHAREFPCAQCGKPVARNQLKNWRPTTARYCSVACRAIARSKGGSISSQGYRVVSVNGKPVLEHRQIMEKILGRRLLTTESVHHRNGDRLDNDPPNLELWVRVQLGGQRVSDLIDYVVRYHAAAVLSTLGVASPTQISASSASGTM